ncbi:MAG: gamma-glutamyl-gamma-aminobutyrate hydrolase family protein [Armatimonadota bacterium]
MCGDLAIPIVGMTLSSRPADPSDARQWDRTTAVYRAALAGAGAQVIEMRAGESALDLDGLDGIVLTGGGDLDPRHYGQSPHPKCEKPDPARDEFELMVARKAIERKLPVLGICRGVQVLGVVLGGQLVQDISSEVPGAAEHRSETKGRTAKHWVELAAGSRLAEVTGARRLQVNSFHHQANSVLGPGAVRVAWCSDGVTEAIEVAGAAFAIGVQWHPERMWRRAPRQRRLFSAFVEACRRGSQTRGRDEG